MLAKFQKHAPESVGQDDNGEELDTLAGLEGDELYKAEFSNDAALKEEFKVIDRYIAFRKAQDAGQVKILKGKEIE